jgi:hypothetical protein
MTAAYTRLGARSYSQRLLERAARLPLPQPFAERIHQEIATLDEELKATDAHEINTKWEDFFSSGKHFSELYELCVKNQFPHMARRLDLLNGNFKFQKDFTVDESEMLKDVFALQSSDDENQITYVLQ